LRLTGGFLDLESLPYVLFDDALLISSFGFLFLAKELLELRNADPVFLHLVISEFDEFVFVYKWSGENKVTELHKT
jgi:hypothetical protein